MPTIPTNITPEDFKRLEDKVDALLSFFNIGQAPRRSNKAIADMAARVVVDMEKKRKRKDAAK